MDPWPAGNFGLDGEAGRRLVRCVSYVRTHPADNGYARPIEGLVAVVDLATGEGDRDRRHGRSCPSRRRPATTTPPRSGELRRDLRPLVITQPEGPSFEVEGSEIRWQRWRLRVSVHPVDGLVLHTVGYEDGGRVRPILHRASIAEMVVPYGDTATNHWWKNAFDVGEWGLGRMMQSLTLGCDCLGEIRYLDAVLADERGGARTIANAVCIHEEDYGILWKHVDLWSGRTEVRRSRRLVISFIATVGNYEYGFYWYFYLDGTIQLEVKLTGIMQTSARRAGRPTRLRRRWWRPELCGALPPAPVLRPAGRRPWTAPPTRSTRWTRSAGPGDGQPVRRTPSRSRATLLATESEAQRMADPARQPPLEGRQPVVAEPSRPARRLQADARRDHVAAGRPRRPASAGGRRFATKNLWVTPFDPAERRPAGDYPNQHGGGDGLPAWTAADRPLVDTDVVLWHTFGVTHVPDPRTGR